jgi:hypothetical protein
MYPMPSKHRNLNREVNKLMIGCRVEIRSLVKVIEMYLGLRPIG